MKKFITGFLVFMIAIAIPAVSFASDGPPTTKESVILDDVNHSSFDFTANAVVYKFNDSYLAITGPVLVVDVGKDSKESKYSNIDHVGLPSYFAWEAHGTNAWPYYNEWLDYKYELTVVHYSQPYIEKVDKRNRVNC